MSFVFVLYCDDNLVAPKLNGDYIIIVVVVYDDDHRHTWQDDLALS